MFAHISKMSATLAIAVSSVLLLAAAAQAQTARFVSSTGDNANNCTRAAPCRTLQRGINATPVGGELQILDSDVYGNAITIGNSITISAVGVAATVGGIVIDAPGAAVVLRSLLLTGTGLAPDTIGISIVNAAAVHIVDCQIERFPSNGIAVSADNVELFISDSVSRGNAQHGLLHDALSSGARVTLDNSRFENNGANGITIAGPAEVAISRVVASGNAANGINNVGGRVNVTSTTAAGNVLHGFAVSGSAAVQMTIELSVARGNGSSGLRVILGIGRVSNSAFTNNGTGLTRTSGTLLSRGNNTVSGNTTQTSGTITALPGI